MGGDDRDALGCVCLRDAGNVCLRILKSGALLTKLTTDIWIEPTEREEKQEKFLDRFVVCQST